MTRSPVSRRAARHLLAAIPLACLSMAMSANAAVVISQVYGGGGNSGATLRSDFIELFNNGSTTENIGGWSVQYAGATGTSWQVTTLPAGTTLAAGRYLLIKQADGAGGTVAVAGDLTGTIAMSGTAGKVALVSSNTPLSGAAPSAGVIDIVSYGSNATATDGSPTATLSNTTAALRKANGCTDTNSNSADFTVAAPSPRNSSSAAVDCGTGSGGGGGTPPPTSAAIYTIQGTGSTSPLLGQKVSTSGVVTKLTNNGFFMQDMQGDGNPLTSDGIFVFGTPASYPAAAVGNLVTVVGTVAEFNVGAATNIDTAAHTVTELTSPESVTLVGGGYSITPTVVSLPELVDGDLERYEGMLVTINGPLTVQQNYFQARYGQLTLAAGGRLETPTNKYRPGSAQAIAMADENARRRIILDDGSSLQNVNPTPYQLADGVPRAGDQTGAITGVIDYGLATASNTGLGDYKIHPTVAPQFTATNPRPTAAPLVGGNVKVASFNVLNFFTTFTDGSTVDGLVGQGCTLGGASAAGNCRGADNLAEFTHQRAKIVEAISALNADAVGLMEIQNNGNFAVNHLVSALNTKMGAGTYASVALPLAGTGSDAIRVAMIYKPARLTPQGAPLSDTDAVNNRPPLAQTFAALNGERFTLVVNHLKSKGSCPAAGDADYTGNFDNGDGQGCWTAQRVKQANRLLSWVGTVQAGAGSSDVLLVGDFNAYGLEDPIYALTSSGYVDQIGRYNTLGYSYVFDGAAGRLDHSIATPSLSGKVNFATHWHINADESLAYDYNAEFKQPACATCAPNPSKDDAYRASDHDPVLVGLGLYKVIRGTTGRDTLVGTPGEDILIGDAGADTITTGAGADIVVYTSMRDAGDVITDFTPGEDRIDLRSLLTSIGQAGATAVANGVVKLVASGSSTLLQIDTDGSAGAAAPRTLVTLLNVSPGQILASRDLILQ